MHRTPNNAQNTQHKLRVAFSYLERNNYVNSPERSSIKFYTGKPCPEVPLLTFYVSFLKKKYSFCILFHSSPMVEGSSGLLQAFYPQGYSTKFYTGKPCPEVQALPSHIPFLTEKVLLSYTIPSLFAVEGWSGLLQAFYPQGVLNKFFTGKPCPGVHVLTFPHTICIVNSMICSDIWHKYH